MISICILQTSVNRIAKVVGILFFMLCTTSYAYLLRLDEDLNNGWDDPDYVNLQKTTADGNILQVTKAYDEGVEQIYSFSDWDGDQAPWIENVIVRIYGKKSGNVSPLQIRVSLGGCWLSPTKTITMTDSYSLKSVSWSVGSGNPYWTVHQSNTLRVGITAPQIDLNAYFNFDYIYVNIGENEDEWYEGICKWETNYNILFDDADATFIGTSPNYDHSGHRICGVGDINLDTIDDFIIEQFDDGSQDFVNSIFLVFGSSSLSKNTSLSGYPSIVDVCEPICQAYDNAELSNTGDLDGDGNDDLLLGTPNLSPGYNFIFPGRSSGWTSIKQPSFCKS